MKTLLAIISSLGIIASQIIPQPIRHFLFPNEPIAPITSSNTSTLNPSQLPSGIWAVKEYKDNPRKDGNNSFDPATYKNPNISGLSFRIYWKDLEPSENQFDWSITDDVFNQAKANNKFVELIIVPGFESPAWALNGVKTGEFARKYGKGAGQKGQLPLPWDQSYLDRWFTFLKAISTRYANNTSFKMIAAAGPTSVSAEMSLPNNPDDLQKWISLGYTPTKYVSAWQKVYQTYSQLFPNQYFGLALYPGLPINDQGQIDQNQSSITRQDIINEGLKYPNQFTLQTSGLNASKDDPNGTGGYDIVLGYNGKIVTGFQMSTSATKNPAKMGDAGNPVNALTLSIDKGLKPGNSGHIINFLEIYEPDILNPTMQPLLKSTETFLTTGETTISPNLNPSSAGSETRQRRLRR